MILGVRCSLYRVPSMPTLINDPALEETLIAERRERGIDKFDEVWDGVYVMAPIANNEHQHLAQRLSTAISIVIDFPGVGRVFTGANVSDQRANWTKNYRVPDVLVFLNGNPAEDRDTHWFGGPDFAVEIVSDNDRSREKIDFYSKVNVRELLVLDRDPWQLGLFRATAGRLESAAIATEQNGLTIHSEVTGLSLRLVSAAKRPAIAVTASDGQSWTI
jgi:Uma2 family endonuclease